jgi:hypothetical protein
MAYAAAGFDLELHVNTNCANWTPASLASSLAEQLVKWREKFSSLPPPVTNRIHCVVWSDFDTLPIVEQANGMRLDTTYYYWPASWIKDRPGFFTGSGMPMRFASSSGSLIDVYQAPTQMTDESGQTYPFTVDTLLDRAIGPEGYFGAFVANSHTDKVNKVNARVSDRVSGAIIRSAMKRKIPVISARQLLTWLDGRNSSTFNAMRWENNSLRFSVNVATGANGLMVMVPESKGLKVTGVTLHGRPIPFRTVKVKGILYASFRAANGAYLVNYAQESSGINRLTDKPLSPFR